jgi:hypothetical protein
MIQFIVWKILEVLGHLSRFEDIWNAHLGSYKDYTSVEGTSPPPPIAFR